MTLNLEAISQHAGQLRLIFFVGIFTLMTLWELTMPRRVQRIGRATRWPSNLSLVVLDTVLVRLLIPTSTVGVALYAEHAGWGVLNTFPIGGGLPVILSIILLDLAIYGQHVLFHFVPVLWRLHRVHHADTEFDVTTGLRFHPIEILLSLLIKFGVVAILGAPPAAVIIFEILLNGTAMFNHSNIRLPARLDSLLRWILVTPDMHRVHHSTIRAETDSNFGFNLPWWDFVFQTYRAEPEAGQLRMDFGVDEFRDIAEQRLDKMLTQPFRNSGAA